MCNWRKWIWPGIIATVLLTALASFFRADHVENELSARAVDALQSAHPWASVALDGRDLTLAGTAPSEEAKAEAAKLADAAYDVRIVKNQAGLLELADPYTFSAVKGESGVTLNGFVPDETTRVELVARTQEALPGLAVTDNLKLARGAPAGFAGLAAFGIGQLADFVTGEASITNTDYTVKGEAVDADAYAKALAAANGALPGDGKLVMAEIVDPTPPPAPEPAPVADAAPAIPTVDPYTWNAVKLANKIVLSGHAPSVDVAAANVEAAKPFGTVIDRQTVALGQPEGYDAAVAKSLATLGALQRGSARMVGTALAIEGNTPDLGVKLSADADLDANAPAGFTLAKTITALPAKDYKWSASKTADGITVRGLAPSPEAKAGNVDVAKAQTSGAVTDEQTLAAGAPANYGAATAFGMSLAEKLTTAEVAFDNGALTVSGAAPDYATKAAVLAMAAPEGVNVKLDVASPAVSPYEWAATKAENGDIVLSGLVPSEAFKARTVEVAKGLTSGSVTDNQVLAEGAPAGYANAALHGLNGLAGLVDGESRYKDSTLAIIGRAPMLRDKILMTEKLTAKPLAFTELTVDISSPPAPALPEVAPLQPLAIGEVAAPAPEPKAPSEVPALAPLAPLSVGEARPAPAPVDPCPDLVASVTGVRTINFDTDRATIKADSDGALEELRVVAEQCPAVRFRVEGHTDSIGDEKYNEGLSEERAQAVRLWLEKRGIAQGRVEAEGFGETRPVADNATVEGRAQNRRIEIQVID